jgi:acyl-CoA synthetase (AMP-forming)/AMP-acid ligase II
VVDGELWLAHDLLAEPGDEAEGWYATGDRVEVIEEQPLRFRFQGRAQSRINVGGYSVYPESVEAALCRHPAIVAARVYGKENQLVGNLLMADCLTADGSPLPPEAELRAFLSRTCQPFEIPRIFKSVDHIDKTSSGKVRR